MNENNPIEIFFKQYNDIRELLISSQEMSLLVDYTNTSRKMLILCCGSYFESEITQLLVDYVHHTTNGDEKLKAFLRKQAIDQKYYTLFDWGKKDTPDKPETKVNRFLGLFGTEFRDTVNRDIEQEQTKCGKNGEQVRLGMQAFLEIGHLRNILVHSNIAQYNYDQKTPEEIYALYNNAYVFVDYIRKCLIEPME